MYDLNSFLKSLTPKYCALISGSISLSIFIFVFIDWFVHRQYDITLIDLIYSKLYSISWIFGYDYPISTRSRHVLDSSLYYHSGLDSKVWRNHLNLFRSCEYDLFEKETNLSPLTNYDMNFTSVDHQEFFTCYNDFCYPEFELMSKVWRLRDKRLRILCSYKALELNSNCSTALLLLAEERSKDFHMVERILRLALKAAENNFNKSKLLIDTFDSKDLTVNINENSNSTLFDNCLDSKLSSKKTKSKSPPNSIPNCSKIKSTTFKSTDFTTLNNLMNKFKFHNIEKEVKELLKELHKDDGDEYDSIIKVLNLKLNYKNNQDATSFDSSFDKECSDLNELILNEIDDALGTLTTENLSYKNYLFTEELIRDYKVILYTRRRLGMCCRKLGKLDEALKLFKELNKELPTVTNFSCLENLMEIYLEIEAYADLQQLLAKYDDIKMPKSASLVYTAALMKMRNCAEKYQNLEEPPLYSSFLSYNYFNQVNYFESPDVHVVNTASKIMNSTTNQQQFINTNLNDNSSTNNNLNNLNSASPILNQNGNFSTHHNLTGLKNGHNLNGFSNGLNGHTNSSISNSINSTNLTNGHSLNCVPIGSPLSNLNTNVAAQLRNEMLALEEIYRAIEFNPHVIIYLLEIKPLTVPPEHYCKRGDTEALAYAFFFLKHWKSVPGALKMLELTWKNAFKLIKNPTKKGHLFLSYPLFIYTIDRKLMQSHFEVSLYPSKDSSLLSMAIISLAFILVLFLALINRFPELLTTDFVAFMRRFFSLSKHLALGSLSTICFLDHVGIVSRVSGTSMQPCLNPEMVDSRGRPYISKDLVFLNKYKVNGYNLERGDIVAFRSPKDPFECLIKRVIALENDVVRTSPTQQKEEQVFQIPKGCIWVEGDNNSNSYDSKQFGCVPIGLIYAKATHIVWPPNRCRRLETKNQRTDNNARILRMFQKNSA